MATSYSYTRQGILDGLDAQRHNAAYAARPLVTNAQRAQDLAKAMLAALDAGDKETAKAHALALRPLLGFLPEEVAA